MKKIISALILSAVIGAAFADVKINLNYRQRANLFTKGGGTGSSAQTEILNTDVYSDNGTDNFQIRLKGDLAQFDMCFYGNEATTDAIRTKNLSASVFLGNLTLWGGFHADGQLNGNYRTKKDVDDGNIEGMDFEFKKLGSAYAYSPSLFVDNMLQNTNAEGENYSGIATYNLKFSSGSLKINGFYISNEASDESSTNGEGNKDHLEGHAGGVLLDGKLDSLGSGELVFKYGESRGGYDAMAFGLYVQSTSLLNNNLILTFGGAGSVVDSTFTDYSLDLRLRWQAIPKKLSITSFHSFSALADPDAVAEDKLFGSNGANPTKSLANIYESGTGKFSSSTIHMKGTASAMARDQILTNNIMARYVVNDWLTVFGIVADMIGMSTKLGEDVTDSTGGNKNAAVIQLRCSGWAQFYAAKSASVAVGLVYAVHDITDEYDDQYCTFAVPVIFRVKM